MARTDVPTGESAYGVPRYYAPGYGRRLTSARLAAGLTQAEAIRYTGGVIAKSALSLAERERREMGIGKLKRLAGLYGVRTEWLVTGAGPRMLDEPNDDEPDDEVEEEPIMLVTPKKAPHPRRPRPKAE